MPEIVLETQSIPALSMVIAPPVNVTGDAVEIASNVEVILLPMLIALAVVLAFVIKRFP